MAWKIYFWLLGVLLVLAYVMLLSSHPTVFDFLDVPISLVALAGGFAFAYKRRLISKGFWRLWLVAIVAWDLAYNLLLTDMLGLAQQLEGEESGTAATLVFWATIVPEYVAIYLYGYRRDTIWSEEGDT